MNRAAQTIALAMLLASPALAQTTSTDTAPESTAAESDSPPAPPSDDAQPVDSTEESTGKKKAETPADSGGETKPVDLSKTTVPGANVNAKEKGKTPAPPDDDLPAWEPAPGSEPTGPRGTAVPVNWDAATGHDPRVTFPWIESHGYFRIRADLFHNFDLDTYDSAARLGTSPVLPPLTETGDRGSGHPEDPEHKYKRGADTLAGANMRFRYQPTIHVSETLRIKTTLDMMDNVVLGSTPDGGLRGGMQRPDVPLVAFSGGQRPPEPANSFQSSARVKQVWGEWKTPLGLLMFGRMPSHWGMGILANGGQCLDCDFGDNVDRIMGVTKLFDTYLTLGWDFVSEGFVGHSGNHNGFNQPYGQPHDFDQRDDVNEIVIALFRRPLTQEEKETRARDLNEVRKPVFDWGVYNVIRSQEFTTTNNNTPGEPSVSSADEELKDTKVFAMIPDLWLKFEHRPQRDTFYRLQFEAVYIWGVIEELPQRSGRRKTECEEADHNDPALMDECAAADKFHPRRRDVRQWGYALEFDHRIDKLQWGVRHGAASGDQTPGFGVLDKLPINDDRDSDSDASIRNFKFDRDYHVDLILFREIIGSVTNAAYFSPYLSYDFVRTDREAWGFKLSPVYSFALEKDATPGRSSQLGLEFDLELYVVEFDRFRWSLAYGILFPFSAFDFLDQEELRKGNERTIGEPGIAQTIQMFVGMQF